MSSTTVALPGVRVARPRPPVAVLAAGALAVLEAVGLLALGLTSLDALWGGGLRPPGALVALTLLALAGWVVLAAAGGASLVDGAGNRLLCRVAVGELVLLAVLGVGGLLGDGLRQVTVGGTTAPITAVAVTAAVVPLAKLLLGTTPRATAWAATDRRPVRAPRPPAAHRRARAVTVAVIGLALVTVCLTTEPAGATASTGTVVDTAH